MPTADVTMAAVILAYTSTPNTAPMTTKARTVVEASSATPTRATSKAIVDLFATRSTD